MVLDMISASSLFFVGIVFLLVGRFFRDATIGVLGGVLLFLQGVYVLLIPVSDLNGMMNLGFGAVLFGVGSYVLLVGGTEALKSNGWWNY